MNVDTGHLISLRDGEKEPAGYKLVPSHLASAANKKLAGQSEAHVSPTSGGRLSRWAADERKKERQHQYSLLKQSRGEQSRKDRRKSKAAKKDRKLNRS